MYYFSIFIIFMLIVILLFRKYVPFIFHECNRYWCSNFIHHFFVFTHEDWHFFPEFIIFLIDNIFVCIIWFGGLLKGKFPCCQAKNHNTCWKSINFCKFFKLLLHILAIINVISIPIYIIFLFISCKDFNLSFDLFRS